MDSLSQLVLGAAVGEAVLGKKIGNRALLWGAIAGTIPDLDVLTRPFLDIVEEIEFHRSISHSVLFFLFLSPIIGYFVYKWSKYKSITTFKEWTLLFFLGFFTHAILDCFTTWGTQLFWPYETRIAWKTIFVVDPIYTVPYLFILIRLAFVKRDNPKRKKLNWTGIILTSSYLLFTVVNKQIVHSKFEQFVKEDKLKTISKIDSRPAPLQNILWTANVETEDKFYIYHYSHLDKKRQKPHFVLKNHHLLSPFIKDKRVKKLIKISEGYYTIDKNKEGIIFNDLRFGQFIGWKDPQSKFVFSFHIYNQNNKICIDEVPKEMSKATNIFSSLIPRIKGYH